MHKKLHQNIIFTVQKVKKRVRTNKLDFDANSDSERVSRDEERNALTSTNPDETSPVGEQYEETLPVPPKSSLNTQVPRTCTPAASAVITNLMSEPEALYRQAKFEAMNKQTQVSKVKMPYELLISRLIDSIETPQIILSR